MMKGINWIVLTLATLIMQGQEVTVVSKRKLPFSEPSDICMAPDGKSFLVPGGKGFLYRCSSNGEVIEKSTYRGHDLEAVTHDGKNIFLSEENFQRIMVLDGAALTLQYSFPLPHGGGRNEGTEACCYLASSGNFLLSTEKDPQFFTLLNAAHSVVAEFQIPGISEISALTEYNGKVYALGDEDTAIYQIDLTSKTIVKTWRLNILNPEGLVFLSEKRCIVVSDDEGGWYELELQ